MKTVIITLSLLLFYAGTEVKPKIIDLDEAIKQELVSVDIKSKGGYSGKCISLKMNTTNGKKLNIRIPAGTHFIPEDEGEQNIFVTTEQMLALTGKETGRFVVAGFCSEKSDRAPGEGSKFSVTKTENEKLNTLANYMADKEIPDDVKQATVWAVANNASVSGIYEKGNQEVKNLRAFVCELTGKPNLWYNTEQEYGMGEDRNIEVNPVNVNGLVDYHADKPGHLSSKLYYENGDKIMDLGKGYDFTKKGRYSFEFDMRVKGWKKGGYYIEVDVNDEVIHKQEFEI